MLPMSIAVDFIFEFANFGWFELLRGAGYAVLHLKHEFIGSQYSPPPIENTTRLTSRNPHCVGAAGPEFSGVANPHSKKTKTLGFIITIFVRSRHISTGTASTLKCAKTNQKRDDERIAVGAVYAGQMTSSRICRTLTRRPLCCNVTETTQTNIKRSENMTAQDEQNFACALLAASVITAIPKKDLWWNCGWWRPRLRAP